MYSWPQTALTYSFNYIDAYTWTIILPIRKFHFVVIIFPFFIWTSKCKNDLICHVLLLVLHIVDIPVYEYLWSIINFYHRHCNNTLSTYYIYDINSRCVPELKYNGKGGKVGEGGGYEIHFIIRWVHVYLYIIYLHVCMTRTSNNAPMTWLWEKNVIEAYY